MMARAIKPGDYVDVRAVAVGLDRDGNLIVRLAGVRAIAEIAIGNHLILDVTEREPSAIAADAVCSSYGEVRPLPQRAARKK
ncbi:hypothetical protein DY467_07550 [Rhodopseudomonas sp. BR0G17]|nr:hypothetical protein [Rhodopseudomonas sp. BR0G17]